MPSGFPRDADRSASAVGWDIHSLSRSIAMMGTMTAIRRQRIWYVLRDFGLGLLHTFQRACTAQSGAAPRAVRLVVGNLGVPQAVNPWQH
jgi:hypothetical protein